jgi:putative membrane protein
VERGLLSPADRPGTHERADPRAQRRARALVSRAVQERGEQAEETSIMGVSTKTSASLLLIGATLCGCRSDDDYEMDDVRPRPAAAGELSPSAFVAQAAAGGEYEVQAATLALQKELDEPVTELATRIRTDHQNTNAELGLIASELGIRLPSGLPERHEQMLEELRTLSGSAFALAWLRQQVEAHREAIDLFERAADSNQDSRLAAFAQRKLPTLRHHLELVNARLQSAASGN